MLPVLNCIQASIPWRISPLDEPTFEKLEKSPSGHVLLGPTTRNTTHNRSLEHLPPVHSRVVLPLIANQIGTDYVNASYVRAVEGVHSVPYVAAMG